MGRGVSGAHARPTTLHTDDRAVGEFDRRAGEYRALYGSTTFEQVHAGILDILPTAGSSVLDIGAGSGRDAAALARRGYDVTAVEPSLNLKVAAEAEHGLTRLEWVQDSLPELRQLGDRRFSFILVSAVWMYLRPEHRLPSMKRLADMSKPGAMCVITIRTGGADAVRGFIPASVHDLAADAAAAGLDEVRRMEAPDTLNRVGVTWTTLVMRRP